MKQHSPLSRLVTTGLVFLFFFSLNLSAQGDPANGEKLFKSVCAACHKLEGKLVGPALLGITDKRDQDWLIAWIKDSPAMIKSGDKLAIQVFEENNRLPMTANPQLSDQDIKDILEYTKGKPVEAVAAVATEVDPGVERGKQIYKTNCAACHKLEGKLIGPPLLKIGDKYEDEWLKLWIKDNAALVASGDKLAKIASEYSPIAMTPFPQLTDQDLDDLLKYMAVGDVAPVAATTAAADQEIFNKPGIGVLPTLAIAIGALLLLSLIVAATTNRKAVADDEESGVSVLKTLI
ncbi:MAG: cytochrome c, partial [Lutibacter sp.]|nr:cytochrome c [Lutibacter sp.]